MGVYDVEEVTLGGKEEARIVFKSLADMEQAYKDIDNGRDIYVKKEGLVTKLLNQMISSRVYDGTIQLSARQKKDEIVGGEKK